MKQIDYTDVLHRKENNNESQANLKRNKYHFTGQCATVLSLLQKGYVLTSRTAMLDHNISDVHRRIGELREAIRKHESDILIQDRWVGEGRGKYKEWFIDEAVKNKKPEPVKVSKNKKLVMPSPTIQQPFNL